MNNTQNLFNLEGKTAVVTGVSRGLGQAMAAGLATAGANIIGISLQNPVETQAKIESYGRKFTFIAADLSYPDQMKEVVQKILSQVDKIDILVNNAGVIAIHPAESYPIEEVDRIFNVNVKSLFILTKEIGAHMLTNGYGRIIQVGSIQSLVTGMHVSAYVASKHAVNGLVKAFATEWGGHGVTVNGIAPGFMVTDNTANLRKQEEAVAGITNRIPLHRWGQPEDLIGSVVFLASNASNYVNGHMLVVDGGYTIS